MSCPPTARAGSWVWGMSRSRKARRPKGSTTARLKMCTKNLPAPFHTLCVFLAPLPSPVPFYLARRHAGSSLARALGLRSFARFTILMLPPMLPHVKPYDNHTHTHTHTLIKASPEKADCIRKAKRKTKAHISGGSVRCSTLQGSPK